MNYKTLPWIALSLSALMAAGMDARPTSPAAAESAPAVSEEESAMIRLWRHPVFQREFMGSYGFRTDIEPKTEPEEREVLERAMALMGRPGGRDLAHRLLESFAGPRRSAVIDFTIGNLHLQAGNTDRAIGWYRRAIAKFPAFLRAHKNLGLAQMKREAWADAIEPLTRVVALGGADGMTYGLLGHAYAQTEQFASAESAYRLAILMQPAVADWQLGLARTLFRLRKFDEAAALCEELIRRDAARPEYWVLLANAHLGQRQPVRAAEIYELLDLEGRATAEHLNTLGDIYVNERLPDLAADAYRRAFARGGPGAAGRLLRAAEVLAARGGVAEAAGLAELLRGEGGTDLDESARMRLLKLEARIAAARGESDERQIALLEEIVRLDPLDGEALILLGQRYAAAGDVERAILQFERAAGIEAVAAEACLRHAQQLVRQRRYAEALPLLKRSVELKPRDEVVRYMEQVERLARPRS